MIEKVSIKEDIVFYIGGNLISNKDCIELTGSVRGGNKDKNVREEDYVSVILINYYVMFNCMDFTKKSTLRGIYKLLYIERICER